MAVTKEQLRKEINEILKDADLAEMSAKKVRLQLEEKLKCDLAPRKKEVDELVMDFVNSKDDDDKSGSEDGDDDDEEEEKEESEEESEEESPKKKTPAKRGAPKRAAPAKKKKKNSSESESGSDDDNEDEESEDDYKPQKAAKGGKKAAPKKKKGSGSDSDEDWKKSKAKGKKAAGGAKKKSTGFTRPYTLSPELASLMGSESLPRHEVVKKVWALIKERNLYDPKNKQYAICDPDLLKVMGVKRFRTFGMLKYLRTHFLD